LDFLSPDAALLRGGVVGVEEIAEEDVVMVKKGTEFISERPMARGVRRTGSRVIRVRRISEWGGRSHYYMDGLRRPVPAWMRRLDGVTVRGLVLAALVLVAGAMAAARLIGGTK